MGYFAGGDLSLDSKGNLYGLTQQGGNVSCGNGIGCGVAYKLWRFNGWKETVLHAFAGGNDGAAPSGGALAFDSKGNLYGGTAIGGGIGCSAGLGCGTVFKLASGVSGWRETVIHQFGNGSKGADPSGGLVFDQAGNAYGTAGAGGGMQCVCGAVYKLVPGANGQWKYSVLHAFNGDDGNTPSGLMVDAVGNLYGTTVLGGPGTQGVVFEITP
ncbi:MAG TPA: choice-of-anchor tandem repeat GloVer-containing protein [Candidatus Sulfotelmatobacter sp.]